MPKFKLDGVEYNSEDLGESDQALLTSIEFADKKIITLNDELHVFQTARATYLNALKIQMEKQNKKE